MRLFWCQKLSFQTRKKKLLDFGLNFHGFVPNSNFLVPMFKKWIPRPLRIYSRLNLFSKLLLDSIVISGAFIGQTWVKRERPWESLVVIPILNITQNWKISWKACSLSLKSTNEFVPQNNLHESFIQKKRSRIIFHAYSFMTSFIHVLVSSLFELTFNICQ